MGLAIIQGSFRRLAGYRLAHQFPGAGLQRKVLELCQHVLYCNYNPKEAAILFVFCISVCF